ncbi:MAG: hypothetical protein ACOX6P_10485 [Candidatus Merdivicinus sp.]|jgi:hypothetical protein
MADLSDKTSGVTEQAAAGGFCISLAGIGLSRLFDWGNEKGNEVRYGAESEDSEF